jgi:hypothetical protein
MAEIGSLILVSITFFSLEKDVRMICWLPGAEELHPHQKFVSHLKIAVVPRLDENTREQDKRMTDNNVRAEVY